LPRRGGAHTHTRTHTGGESDGGHVSPAAACRRPRRCQGSKGGWAWYESCRILNPSRRPLECPTSCFLLVRLTVSARKPGGCLVGVVGPAQQTAVRSFGGGQTPKGAAVAVFFRAFIRFERARSTVDVFWLCHTLHRTSIGSTIHGYQPRPPANPTPHQHFHHRGLARIRGTALIHNM
jgi:hypothetical protein